MRLRGASLPDLLDLRAAEPFGDWTAVRVFGLSTDSRRVHPGDLFFGLPGGSREGARYALDALRRGAAAFVLPLGAAVPPRSCGIRHPDPFQALACAARRFYQDPGAQLEVVGVTGTNGKTTTALLTERLLSAGGKPQSLWSTTLVRLPSAAFRPQWTTPPAHELQRFLRAAADQGTQGVVMEVSSHGVVQQRIAGVHFAVGIATNFSPDHLDFHGTVEAYFDAKRAFIQGLGAGAAAILNADDPRVLAMGEGAEAEVFTYGEAPSADVRLSAVRPGDGVLEGVLSLRGGRLGPEGDYPFRLPMAGRHNAYNAAAAFAAAVRLGVPAALAAQEIKTFEPPPRRLEREAVGPYVIYNDVAMNEASYDAVLGTLAEDAPGGLVVVHALRGNRGTLVNARIAEIFARWDRRLRFAPLIVSESRSDLGEDDVDRAVRPAERDAFVAAAARGGLRISLHVELDAAIEEAALRLSPGGTLLLLGTFGMDRGPAKARAVLRRRLGLAAKEERDYLVPEDDAF